MIPVLTTLLSPKSLAREAQTFLFCRVLCPPWKLVWWCCYFCLCRVCKKIVRSTTLVGFYSKIKPRTAFLLTIRHRRVHKITVRTLTYHQTATVGSLIVMRRKKFTDLTTADSELTRKQEVFLARVQTALELLAQSVLGDCLQAIGDNYEGFRGQKSLETTFHSNLTDFVAQGLGEILLLVKNLQESSSRVPKQRDFCEQQTRHLPECPTQLSQREYSQAPHQQRIVLPGVAQGLADISTAFYRVDQQKMFTVSQMERIHRAKWISEILHNSLLNALNYAHPLV